MDLFNKASKAAKSMGDNVMSSAKNMGNTIYSSTKEQSELAGLNIQASVLERKLESHYAEIGKRYVEYINKCETESVFNVDDIIEQISPDVEKLMDIRDQISEKEEHIRQGNLEREKKKAQDEFDAVKKRLDKALEMDIISDVEYEIKLSNAQKKLDNYEQLHKIRLQYQMDIITKEEYDEKVNELIN